MSGTRSSGTTQAFLDSLTDARLGGTIAYTNFVDLEAAGST